MPGKPLDQFTVVEPRVLVLADAEDVGARRIARGHLFEKFVAHVLHRYGYESPSTTRLNVTADGIELDVAARHQLTSQPSIAECKAYGSPVPTNALNAFYGKLTQARFTKPNTHGFFVALPRLTGPGDEQARNIDKNDAGFTYLNAEAIVRILRDLGEIKDLPYGIPQSSDPAVIITEHGTFSAVLELDDATRSPKAVRVWSSRGTVPQPVIDLLSASDYSADAPIAPLNTDLVHENLPPSVRSTSDTPVIVAVEGSKSDFEYQLPASPKFFVGRKRLVSVLDEVISAGRGAVVLNAQSGWGKSSLALMLGERARIAKGHALVLDSRTVAGPRYVTEALREAGHAAAEAGLLTLPPDPLGAHWRPPCAASQRQVGTRTRDRWSSSLTSSRMSFATSV